MKVSLENLSAFQINLLMGTAMLVVSIPAVIVFDRTSRIPTDHLALGIVVAILMAVGSLLYALALSRLPAGPVAAIATSYVVIVVVLSAIFLREKIDLVSVTGIAFTLGGVAMLSFRT